MDNKIEYLENKCFEIRKKCLNMCIKAHEGHITSAFSCAEIVIALYYEIMNIKEVGFNSKLRDRFIMSKNHGSVITYPVLADLGFIPESYLDKFNSDESLLKVHTTRYLNGVEFSGGSLGIGLGYAVGIAYASKLKKENYSVFCCVGDGECYEGSIWESAICAAGYKLNNLVVFIDRNKMCMTDFTEHMLPIDSLAKKWDAFGWEVREINGHDFSEILEAVHDIKSRKNNKPLCIIASTNKGEGIEFMTNKMYMHGYTPSGSKADLAVEQLERGYKKHEY